MNSNRPVIVAVFLAVVICIPIGLTESKSEPPTLRKNFTQPMPVDAKLAFEMVYIPGGTFEMGSPDGEAGRQPNEGPTHKVTVGPFWMSKHEVRWDEFDLWWKNETLPTFPKDAPYGAPDAITKPTNPYVPADYGHGQEGFPALCMSHHAAMMYCHWLRRETKKGYRLPTEAEWEFACRAGSKTAYSFGDDPDKVGDYAQLKANSIDEDHPRGTSGKCGAKKPNAFGLHDMHGNVAEWVLDLSDSDAYATRAKLDININPVTLPKDKKWGHIARGGSFKDDADKLRSAARRVSDKTYMKFDPQSPQSVWWLTKRDEIGFRLCLPVDELPLLKDLKPLVEKKVENDE